MKVEKVLERYFRILENKEKAKFLIAKEKGIFKKTIVEPFDKSKLKLITIDFVIKCPTNYLK